MAETPKTTKTRAKAATASASEKKAAPSSKAPTVKKAAAPRASKPENVTPEKRYCMIAEAAYFRAQSHQFKSDPVRDWIEAEQEIDAMLAAKPEKKRCG